MKRALIGGAIGVWLLFAPRLVSMGGVGVAHVWLCGLVTLGLAILGYWDATRGALRLLAVLGAWLAVSASFFHYGGPRGRAAIIVTGLAILGIFARASAPRGLIGGGWRALWRPQGAPVRPDPFSLSPDEL